MSLEPHTLLLELENINHTETRKTVDLFIHLLRAGFPEDHIRSELIKHIDALENSLSRKHDSLIQKVYNELKHFKDHGSIHQAN